MRFNKYLCIIFLLIGLSDLYSQQYFMTIVKNDASTMVFDLANVQKITLANNISIIQNSGTTLVSVDDIQKHTFNVNYAPYTPNNPNPTNGIENVVLEADLNWTGGDPDEDPVTYDVYFGTMNPPTSLVRNGINNSTYQPNELEYNTKYYWKIISSDGGSQTEGPVWNFTTEKAPNQIPYVPNSPDPNDKSNNIPLDINLSWMGDDPDGDEVFYDVYLDKDYPPVTKLASKLIENLLRIEKLEEDQTYYWRIISSDGKDIAFSPVWSFHTISLLPPEPILLLPENGSECEKEKVELSWKCEGLEGDSFAYDVYLDINHPPIRKLTDRQEETFFRPESLAHEQTYYWRINVSNTHGETLGPVWTFSTSKRPNQEPHIPSSPSPADGAENQLTDIELSWTGGDPDGDMVTYDIYFDTSNPPSALVSQGQSETSYDPGTLDFQRIFFWRVTASDGRSKTEGPVWSFTTEEGTVSLAIPSNHSEEIELTPKFQWNASTGADSYDLQVSLDNSFMNIVLDQTGISEVFHTVTTPLEEGTVYYWRIRRVRTGKEGNWCAPWSFTTLLNPPVLSSPTDGALNTETSIKLNWTKMVTADTYDLEVSRSGAVIISETGLTETSYQAEGLSESAEHTWRVRSRKGTVTSAWTDPWCFTVKTVYRYSLGDYIPSENGFQWTNNYQSMWPDLRKEFPTWELFVKVYGQEHCYVGGSPSNARLRQAEDFWNHIKRIWNGSCAGFTIASLGFFQGEWDVTAYGGTNYTYEIPHNLSENEIVEWINRLQFHQNYFRHWTNRSNSINGVRNVVDSLLTGINRGYYMSIGGHAVLPYKIEDQGGGIYHIYIYNNWFLAFDEDYIVTDYNSETWTYWALDGVRDYLRLDVGEELIPTPRMREYYKKNGLAREGYFEEKISIFSNMMDFYLSDSQCGISGYQNGSYVNEALNCDIIYLESDTSRLLCRYELPADSPYRLYLDESGTEESEMDMMIFEENGFFRYRETRDSIFPGAREIALTGTGEYGIRGRSSNTLSAMEIVLNENKDEIDMSYMLRGTAPGLDDSLKIWNSNDTVEFELNVSNYGKAIEYELVIESRLKSDIIEKNFKNIRINHHEKIKVEVENWKSLQISVIKVRVDNNLDNIYDSVYFLSGETNAEEWKIEERINKNLINYPNPFNTETKILYTIEIPGNVNLSIYDLSGQRVATLITEAQERGEHEVIWKGRNSHGERVSSGVYLLRLKTAKDVIYKKVLLLK